MREVVLWNGSAGIYSSDVSFSLSFPHTLYKKKKSENKNPGHAHRGYKDNSDFIQALKSKLEIYILWKVNNEINYTKKIK